MTCKQLKEQFDDYVDGNLDKADTARLEQHVACCEACQELIDREQRLKDALREYGDSSVPTPDATFYDQALARAAHVGNQQQQKHWWLKGFGSAVAAGVALWIIGGMLPGSPEIGDPGSTIPAISMVLEEPRTINLVFSSAKALEDATLTVSLPQGVELAGFPGQREITWTTSLSAGRNVLPLKLIASSPQGGEILATLQHENDDKTFRLRVTVI